MVFSMVCGTVPFNLFYTWFFHWRDPRTGIGKWFSLNTFLKQYNVILVEFIREITIINFILWILGLKNWFVSINITLTLTKNIMTNKTSLVSLSVLYCYKTSLVSLSVLYCYKTSLVSLSVLSWHHSNQIATASYMFP